jgi:pilus assembly protein FimV
VHKSKINKISLAVCLAFMPIYGFTAGLGKLNVDSGLGEPLKAQIDLLSVTPDELSTLTASIASEEAYAVQGIPRLGVHNSIRVELGKNPDGSPVLRLRSQQPIDDPYLDMLIQVDWASGRLLREYTILLDPPGYKQTVNEEPLTQSAINKPYTASGDTISAKADTGMHEAPPRLADKSKVKKKAANVAADTSGNAEGNTTAVNDSAELTTQRGDTLSSIAREVASEGVSLDQVMVGLFEANKSAFTDGNMNRLKVGQIIKVPSKDELTTIDPKQAKKEIKLHASNWNTYKNSLAGNVVAAPVAEEVEQKQSASGKIATAEDKAAPVKSGPQDVVKLSAGGKVAAQGGKGSAEADAKVLALQEEATAREKALKEAQERTTALEAQVADMQKLLALKSQTMADMQKNADAAAKSAQMQQPAVTPQPAPAAADASAPAAVAEPAPAAVAEPAPTPALDASKPAEEVKKSPAVVKPPVQAQPEEEQPSFIASLLESVNLFMLGGAGGVALLGAGWVYLRNKRRKDLDSFERGILTSGGLRANTVFGNTTGNATSSADTSFLTDFAQSADGAMIDTNDVDPIAEAEVYMAYGRDAQAEEILKDAISKEPKRYELHLKLLEMYAARKDVSAFEAVAGELYTTLGADDPTWAKVAELGITVEPDNPLYDISQIVSVTPAVNAAAGNPGPALADMDMGKDLDFSLDKAESTSEAELSKESIDLGSFNSEFSTDITDAPTAAAATVAAEDVAAEVVTESADNTVTAAADSQPAADNSMDFDFPDFGSFGSNAEQPVTANEQDSLDAANTGDAAPALELPTASANEEIVFAAAAPDESSSALAGLDFNFNAEPVAEQQAVEAPEVAAESVDFNFEGFTDAASPVEPEKTESNALDAVDFSFEGFGESTAEANEDKQQASALEGISLNFEADDTSSAVADGNKPEEISFDFPLADASELPAIDKEAGGLSQNEANHFDFSAISLDLSDSQPQADEAPQVAADIPVPGLVTEAAVENENPDVDIKLDLVKVYIDMEDIEGARDLLDEVLKEGGPQQRITAEKLLAGLA